MRILLVGHGRMGRLVEATARDHGCEVAGRVTHADQSLLQQPIAPADVAIDFSTADAFLQNLPRLAAQRMNVVVGTTGWQARESEVRRAADEAGIGVVAAANFSIGVNVFQAVVERAASLFAAQDRFGAWIHEMHHAAKRDAPSGTALTLQRTMESAGYARAIDVSSTRAGSIPGVHTIGFDGPFETITLTHSARDRAAFAQGALIAARWVAGKQGWFSMKDVLELGTPGQSR